MTRGILTCAYDWGPEIDVYSPARVGREWGVEHMCASVRLIWASAETQRLLNIESKTQTASGMEKEAVAALHRTMRVLREELEEREATIRRLRRRRRNVAKKRGGGQSICLFTMEDAGSEEHQRLDKRQITYMWKVDLSIFSFICQVLSFCFAFRNFQNLDNFLNCRLKVRLVQQFI